MERYGRIEPSIVVIDDPLIEEPDLEGPGKPPRRVGIGGGLEDFGGEVPPTPPTAESSGSDEERQRNAWRFADIWRGRVLTIEDYVRQELELSGLLARSCLIPEGIIHTSWVYRRAYDQQRSPNSIVPLSTYGITAPVTPWSTGMFCDESDAATRRVVNDRLYHHFSTMRDELGLTRRQRSPVSQLLNDPAWVHFDYLGERWARSLRASELL